MKYVNHIFIFAIVLALLVSLVEIRVAKYVGKSIALKQWKTAIIAFFIGLALVIFLITRQSRFDDGIIILNLFLVSILLSYEYAYEKESTRVPDLIYKYISQLQQMRSLKITLPKDIEIAKKNLHLMAENQVESNMKSNRDTINNSTLEIEKLTKERDSKKAKLDILEKDAIAEIKRVYNNY